MKKTLFLVFIMIASISNGQDLNTEIDTYINQIKTENEIPGLALAVIRKGKVIHKEYYGFSNLDYDIPVTDLTIFPLFSTSKIFATVGIHNLIQEGKLNLNDKISKYLKDLPVDWNDIQIKNLLSHSSGLPEIAAYGKETEEHAKSKVYKDTIKFEKGFKFDYNQTNFWLLNRIVEEITKKTLSDYILETQFNSNNDEAIFDGFSENIVKNRATSYCKLPLKPNCLKVE